MYELLKYTINNGRFDKDDMLNKLNVFFNAGSLTREQFDELLEALGAYTISA